jgi:hypothetical protein
MSRRPKPRISENGHPIGGLEEHDLATVVLQDPSAQQGEAAIGEEPNRLGCGKQDFI